MNPRENTVNLYHRHKEESSSSDEDLRAAKQGSSATQSDPGVGSGGVSYKKTLRLTSEQLVRSYFWPHLEAGCEYSHDKFNSFCVSLSHKDVSPAAGWSQ